MSNNETAMVVPVTNDVRENLARAENTIKLMDMFRTAAYPHKRLNDSDHFANTVERLEALTLAVLRAPAAGSLLVPKTGDARFDMGSRSPVPSVVNESAVYLHNTAAVALRNGDLSDRGCENSIEALGQLKLLFNVLKAAIITQARKDLATLGDASIKDMCFMAKAIAERTKASQCVPDTGLPELLDEPVGAERRGQRV